MNQLLKRFGLRGQDLIFNSRWVFVLWVVLFSGCGLKTPKEEKPIASVTISPIQFFMNRLAGEALEVNVMVPQGANPSTYSPTPGQIRSLSGATLYVRAGYLGFEMAWMDRLMELNSQMRVVNLSDGLTLIKGDDSVHGDHVHEGGIDPHIWMSPRQVLRFLPVLKEALITTWPAMTDSVNGRYDQLVSEVQQRDEALQSLSRKLTQPKFMIFHPALTYLARDYGFEQHSIEYEGKEPSPVALKNLIDLARHEEIRVIFIQEEFDKRNAQLVSQETGAHLMIINPLASDWYAGMDAIIDLFGQYLR